MAFSHPWIDESLDAEEMEAVLVAGNELPAWDSNATVRAFQTYLWSNASTGEHTSFVHDETGVIVGYDGNVVGIECGHGSLVDALPDLLRVLHGMGWRSASVYCLTQHMQELMADIGRSIPANMDFDVQEAKRGAPINSMPEAQGLRDRTREVLRAAAEISGVETSEAQVLAVMQSLDKPMATAQPVTAPIQLADDDGGQGADEEVFVAPGLTQGGMAVGASPAPAATDALESDEAPRVFEIGPAPTAPRADALASAPAETATTPTMRRGRPEDRPMAPPPDIPAPARPETADQRRTEWIEIREGLQRSQVECERLNGLVKEHEATIARQRREAEQMAATIDTLRDYERMVTEWDANPEAGSATRAVEDDLVHVGQSAFYFAHPSQSIHATAETLARVQAHLGAVDVVEVWPGAIGQTVRWNVVGELDPQQPLFAQTWTRWVFGDCSGAVEIAKAALILTASRNNGLRDVERALPPEVDKAAVRAVLSPLSLIREGDAFIDPQAPDGEDVAVEVFTVRGVLASDKARLFVVHHDSLDGEFAAWMIGLLEQFAKAYAASRWCARQVVPPAAPETPMVAVAEEVAVAVPEAVAAAPVVEAEAQPAAEPEAEPESAEVAPAASAASSDAQMTESGGGVLAALQERGANLSLALEA